MRDDIAVFARSVLSTWFAYVGLIPALYDFVSTYLPKRWSVYRFEEWFLYTVPAISVLFAAFRVWRDQRDETQRLSAELATLKANEAAFELTAEGWGLASELQSVRAVLPKRLLFAREELTRRRGRSSQERYFSTFGSDSASWALYVERLEKFEAHLARHDALSPTCAHVVLSVKNVGTRYDEQIHILVWHERPNVKFVEPRAMQIELPEPPSDRMQLPDLRPTEPPFRKIVAVTHASIEVEFRALRAHEDDFVLRDGIYIIGEGTLELHAEISSKNTRAPVRTKLTIDLSQLSTRERSTASGAA